MKIKHAVTGLAALIVGLSGVVHAAGDYFPPERIHCAMSSANKLSCEGFSKDYLVEDTYTVNFPAGKDVSLYFKSGVAYFTPDQSEMSIFFTYKDINDKTVKLKTVNNSIRPDLTNGAWKKFKQEFYTCDSGYMSCPITNLPGVKTL
jgi:hypothetical protein